MQSGDKSWQIGVDIGGTFTDIAAVDNHGHVFLWKEPTTREQRDLAVVRGLTAAATGLGVELSTLLTNCTRFVHGSTVATNTLIERDGARVGLVATKGFRDILYFRDGFKWERFNARLPRPADFVDRDLRLGVSERVVSDGSIHETLDEGQVRQVAQAFRRAGVEAVAVSLLWSFVNPTHERRVREILSEELEDVPVLLSSDILPELGEWQRTSATVLSSYIYSATFRYLESLRRWLAENGLAQDLLVMQINGGCASPEQVMRVPVTMTVSGPAAAPAAALRLAEGLDTDNLICIDMGGTSLDVCVVADGEVPRARNIMVEHQPIGIPGVEIHSVGAGGGSIAWIDSGGALRVGPESSGSSPGPAAYDRGGRRPTVTDANVALGYLSPDAFLGGRWRLRKDLAEEAIERDLAQPLGCDVTEAAVGILNVVNENMLAAIRTVSVERGIDPRPFTLVAGGGAGPLHASRLAAELGVQRVLVPAEAGTLSAYGMTVADVRHDYTAAAYITSAAPAVGTVVEALRRLEGTAKSELQANGVREEAIRLDRTVDARYAGQVHELTMPVPGGVFDGDALVRCAEAFHAAHAQRFGYSLEGTDVEFLHWRVAGIGVASRIDLEHGAERPADDAEATSCGERSAFFADLGGFVDTPVYSAKELSPGAVVLGPALIDSPTTTIVVTPGLSATVDTRGGILLQAADAATTALSGSGSPAQVAR
jgi:N-methylhydantoinase A